MEPDATTYPFIIPGRTMKRQNFFQKLHNLRQRHPLSIPVQPPPPPPPPPRATDYQHELPRRRDSHTSLASVSSSTLSSFDVDTDYGLHRALHSIIVPNEENPIATKKDRKNANYLEKLHADHKETQAELEKAIAEYQSLATRRESEREDPNLDGILSRHYRKASGTLVHCSMEYNAFVENLQTLRDMPRVSRTEMRTRIHNKLHNKNHGFHATRPQDREGDRDDTEQETDDTADTDSMRQQLGAVEQQILELEREREDLIKRTDAVDRLAAHVGYVEHVNRAMQEQCDRMRRADERHTDEKDRLVEDLGYIEHIYRQAQTENSQLCAQLQAVTAQRREDMRLMRREAAGMLAVAREEMERLRVDNRLIRSQAAWLQTMLDFQDVNAASSLRTQIGYTQGQIAGHTLQEASLAGPQSATAADHNQQAQVAPLEAQMATTQVLAPRRDSVVSVDSDEKHKRSVSI